MKQAYFNSSVTKKLLETNHLAEFDQLWNLKTAWFEEPNYRRNGWSGVIKYPLVVPGGETSWIFIKRQENHNCKTVAHPIGGVPTFQREYQNIKHLNNNNIPTLTTLYYDERRINGKNQAILITQSLEGYHSFEQFFSEKENADIPQRSEIMALAGQIIRKMHDAHFRHNCLYAKHLFVKVDAEIVDVRLIDLEKLKWLPFLRQVRKNDLSRLIRRGEPMTHKDLQNILSSYYQTGDNIQHSALADELDNLLDNQKRYEIK